MSKLGGILFVFILIIVAFGIASFSAEFFFWPAAMDFIEDFVFIVFKGEHSRAGAAHLEFGAGGRHFSV